MLEHKKESRLKDLQLCALVVAGGRAPEVMSLDKTLLVVGSEAHGLPQEVVDACDLSMTVPMAGPAESLNAAVAGAIALYLQYQSLIS